ncbi:hypothetical protein BDY21DRAFT_421673 [Lineolata rhizophorae]|uniref:Uncharacterized protein n=1 Tax=Lineolata rhizophorae TaxID=578093 RepID=A0A6A6NZF0_9PEZI|nr:hypothetical protein BDY21DRAFT_421673 [Lineolata rhizophorae]
MRVSNFLCLFVSLSLASPLLGGVELSPEPRMTCLNTSSPGTKRIIYFTAHIPLDRQRIEIEHFNGSMQTFAITTPWLVAHKTHLRDTLDELGFNVNTHWSLNKRCGWRSLGNVTGAGVPRGELWWLPLYANNFVANRTHEERLRPEFEYAAKMAMLKSYPTEEIALIVVGIALPLLASVLCWMLCARSRGKKAKKSST